MFGTGEAAGGTVDTTCNEKTFVSAGFAETGALDGVVKWTGGCVIVVGAVGGDGGVVGEAGLGGGGGGG